MTITDPARTPSSASSYHAGGANYTNLPLRLVELPRTNALLALHATARDRDAGQARFVTATRRIIRMLLEEAIGLLSHETHTVTTPLGEPFHGAKRRHSRLIAVSVPRAGDAMESELREIAPESNIGKVLVQRDPITKKPSLFYTKLPANLEGQEVLLMDPMMATGGTICLAIEVLLQAGVAIGDIVLVNFLTCPSALQTIATRFPNLRVVTSFVDEALTPEAFMNPGIGDFGDRFYGTLA
jgi:uracil phosphoribosyltransferase